MTGTHSMAAARRDRLTVGLFIPVSGPAGLWGPSCRACAELAAEEINRRGGLLGRDVALRIVDAGGTPEDIASDAELLIEDRDIDAIVGMHTSDVRVALGDAVAGTIPYIYTPLYEGGERRPGVYCIGETPARQLLQPLDWLAERYGARRWFLLGNDYVWPRRTHRLLRWHARGRDLDVTGERYVPFGTRRFEDTIDTIVESGADAVLLSLVGDDAVRFNRLFGAHPASEKILRFSCAIEENALMAIGAARTGGLFVSSGYHAGLRSGANGGFLERYHARFGERAPTLNAIGQSIYEGMHFLNALAGASERMDWRRPDRSIASGGGVRNLVHESCGVSATDIYLAEAAGHHLDLVATFPSHPAGVQ